MSTPSVKKQPSESRLYSMDFSALLAKGETVVSVTSVTITPTTSSPLTVSGVPTASGVLAQFRLIDGLTGQRYKLDVIVTTSSGNILEGDGLVQVEQL